MTTNLADIRTDASGLSFPDAAQMWIHDATEAGVKDVQLVTTVRDGYAAHDETNDGPARYLLAHVTIDGIDHMLISEYEGDGVEVTCRPPLGDEMDCFGTVDD